MIRRATLLSTLLGCATSQPPPPPPAEAPAAKAEAQPEERAPERDPNRPVVSVFALSDFHGWLLPLEPKGFPRYYGGIANLAGMLEHKEKLDPGSSLILDNGDMWTGPTESTLLRGESVINAYNQLGVAAANVANHEFDFGVEVLRARVAEAKFPFLGANIVETGTKKQPDFVKPYVIVERAGFKVGVLGLSYIDTPKTTLAKHVAGLEFKPYQETLETYIPKMKEEGAEVIVVLFHDEIGVVEKTIKAIPGIDIHAVVAGQNHRKGQTEVSGIPIVNPGPFGRSYVRFDVHLDKAARKVEKVDHEIVDITGEVGAPPFPPSPELVAIVESARQKANTLADEVLGRLAKPLPIGTFAHSPLGQFVVDCWIRTFPDLDVAMLNLGAIRQPLGSGNVTVGDLMSVLPFENNLYVVQLTGKQLRSQLEIDNPVVAGISWSYKEQAGKRDVVSIVDPVGRKLQEDKTYKVAILDFMYSGGDGYEFQELDTSPEDTGLSWREPVMRALRTAESTRRSLAPQSNPRARRVR